MATGAVSLVLIGGGCGSGGPAATGNGRLTGVVEMCLGSVSRCAPVAATVTLLRVNGTTLGSAVGKQYAADGRFSFIVAPGKYFPSASLGGRSSVHGCIAGQTVVGAHQAVTAYVSCTVPVRSPAR